MSNSEPLTNVSPVSQIPDLVKTHLVDADENGYVQLGDEATAFVGRAIDAIKGKLHENVSFRLMPYRYEGDGAEFLGFDWSDPDGGSVSFTFWCDESEILLPNPVIPNSNDVIVRDFIDAIAFNSCDCCRCSR